VPPKRGEFLQRALKLRGERAKEPKGVFPEDMRSVIESASRKFPLVTLHREAVDPDCCYIGQVKSLGKKILKLREIDPDATWDPQLYDFSLDEITKINFGGRYEEALALAANLTA